MGFFGECTAFAVVFNEGPGAGDADGSFVISSSMGSFFGSIIIGDADGSFVISSSMGSFFGSTIIGDAFAFDPADSFVVDCPGVLKNDVIDF